ncbi:MAG: ParB/RepB/Spo0J family partition protein [Tabrizicola sp.]|jgi:ParB family chromosome partitioning protein|nr:ParB/RepB/Spo0J family partition protein [Tabrizicola sp.]
MDPLIHLPPAAIDPHALLRDRTTLDDSALALLQHSIATEGLRAPLEVWALSTPRGPHTHGLISGLRRLTAARALGLPTVPCFLRTPQSLAQALAAMVSENEIREPVSPYEKAALVLAAVEEGHFDTPDAAIATLFPSLPRTSRTRIRHHARVVEDLGPLLAAPHQIGTRQLDMLAAALATGHEPLLTATLQPLATAGVETQWSTLRPLLAEVLRDPTDPITRRPRRHLRLPQGLTITREPTPTGWLLRFTGPQARSGLIDDVLDKVEEWFGKP